MLMGTGQSIYMRKFLNWVVLRASKLHGLTIFYFKIKYRSLKLYGIIISKLLDFYTSGLSSNSNLHNFQFGLTKSAFEAKAGHLVR